jgi:soluble P-type ATPase
MMTIDIPSFAKLHIKHLVLDFNGTLACDGILIDGVAEILAQLAGDIHIHILTADLYGSVQKVFADSPYTVFVIPKENEDSSKAAYIDTLGAQETVSIGNGRNDCLMLEKSALGIAVIQHEGASLKALMAADVVTTNILDAFHLLLNPKRLVATLRF